jgi:hypothetical protein
MEILMNLKMELPFSVCWLWGMVSLNINPTMGLIQHQKHWPTDNRHSIGTE